MGTGPGVDFMNAHLILRAEQHPADGNRVQTDLPYSTPSIPSLLPHAQTKSKLILLKTAAAIRKRDESLIFRKNPEKV